MPLVPDVLKSLVMENIRQNMIAVNGYDPLASPNPSYFIEMCSAFGKGIAQATKTLQFTTKDAGMTANPPVPGVGTGVGIHIDSDFMSQQMYTNIRNSIISKFKITRHDPWIPSQGNSGEYLKAITDGISSAVKTHFKTAWTLNSTHNVIYIGTGNIKPTEGNKFTGLVESQVSSAVTSLGVRMRGSFWPELCKGIAKGYVTGVEQTGSGTVTITGTCIPNSSPFQACALPDPGNGSGSGTAT